MIKELCLFLLAVAAFTAGCVAVAVGIIKLALWLAAI